MTQRPPVTGSRHEVQPPRDGPTLPPLFSRFSATAASLCCFMCVVCMCVCERAREPEMERETALCICVCALKFGFANPIVKNATFVYI